MLKSHGRFDYSPIHRRADFAWPGGKRLAVYVALNLEAYSFGEGMIEEIAPPGPGPAPDVMNWSWLEYGNRIGAWRLRDMFHGLGMPCTLLVNAEVYAHCPELPQAFQSDGHEIGAHGRTNSELQGNLPEADEAALIAGATRAIEAGSGKRPAGWLGPWISESRVTPDLLHEAGYEYVLDWCCDDQPFWLKTRKGRILAVPYPQELNDSNTVIGRRVNPDDFADMIVDNFEEMREQSTLQPLVMGISLHAHCAGQPFRLRHFRRALSRICKMREEIWLTTAGGIARHYQGETHEHA
ncbi:MAG: polysaccharide deacetylase family protein [Burkholderiales bacterium]